MDVFAYADTDADRSISYMMLFTFSYDIVGLSGIANNSFQWQTITFKKRFHKTPEFVYGIMHYGKCSCHTNACY